MENLHSKDLDEQLCSEAAKPESLPDEAVIRDIAGGNTEQFEILIKRYNQQLFRIIRSYLYDREDVKDVMQTTYLKAYKNLNRFRGESKFSTWLIRIGINEALKKLKSQKNENRSGHYSVTDDHQSDQKNSDENNNPESKMIQKDMQAHLEKAIDTLPPKYRSVLIMRKIEQLSTEETAEILNISQSNVKVRLHRAKNMLRDELTQMLSEADLFSFRGDDCERMTKQVMNQIKRR